MPELVMWLVLDCQVPAKLTVLNQMMRRELAAAGAVYLAPDRVAVPHSVSAQRVPQRLCPAVTGAGGQAAVAWTQITE